MEIKNGKAKVNWKGEDVEVPYIVREDNMIFVSDYIADGNDKILMYYIALQDGVPFYEIDNVYFYPLYWIRSDCSAKIEERCFQIKWIAQIDGLIPFYPGYGYGHLYPEGRNG